jgi:hypothetical protein
VRLKPEKRASSPSLLLLLPSFPPFNHHCGRVRAGWRRQKKVLASFNLLEKAGFEPRTCKFQALVLQVRHPDCFRARPTRGPMPVPSDDANAVKPLPTLPLPSLHRRRPLQRNLRRPPKNRRCRRPPPIRAGEVTKLAAGPAAVD